jgi:hypothetical protein
MVKRRTATVALMVSRVLLVGLLALSVSEATLAVADPCECMLWDRLAYDDDLDACVFCYSSGAVCGCNSTCQDDPGGEWTYGSCIPEPS